MEKIKKISYLSCLLVLIFGTLFHFIYQWIGGSFIAIFGAVNESTWEHLKLIFWPMLIATIIEFIIYGRQIKGLIPIKIVSIILGMVVTIVSFYTYTGVLGFNFLVADILTFIFGVLIAYYFSLKQFENPSAVFKSRYSQPVFIAIGISLVICFIVFTFYPPHIGLFLDPVTKKYGMVK